MIIKNIVMYMYICKKNNRGKDFLWIFFKLNYLA